MLSDVVRTLAARRIRAVLVRLQRLPLASALTGSLLGMVTQSSNAATYVCIGLLNSRAIGFRSALSISAWAGAGTSLLVFLASIDLRYVAFLAIATVAVLYLASLHRKGVGRSTTELLVAVGITLLGLAMIKGSGHALEHDPWVAEFFVFSAESWVYGFLIGFGVTLLMQSSSTVSILAVAMSAANLIPLAAAIVLVCGSNLGSGVSVALAASHLRGEARHLAIWQALVKGLGALVILLPTLAFSASGAFAGDAARGLPVPTAIAVVFLALNVFGAALADLLKTPLMALLERLAPFDPDLRRYELQHIIDESADDPETALLLARQEQSRLISLLPEILAPLRPDEEPQLSQVSNAERRALGTALTERIAGFVSEALNRHPDSPDRAALLLLQRCNNQILPLQGALHDLVDELAGLGGGTAREGAIRSAMSESLHLLLTLLADHAAAEPGVGAMLREMTADRSEVMTRFRKEIVAQSPSGGKSPEALVIATTLFERIVWLIAQVSKDLAEVGRGD